MSEQKKSQQTQEAAQIIESASAATPSSGWKRLMSKKWAFPALYMVAAAIILTLMWAYQNSAKQAAPDTTTDVSLTQTQPQAEAEVGKDALPVAAATETLGWPVQDKSELDVVLPFYDSKGSAEAKQAAMVQYGETFTPHVGVDLAREDNKTFDVMAAGSGKVTAVEKNPIVGNLVEITHSNGLISIYQSLSDVKVAKGAEVKKGDVIATAGRNELEMDEGVHVHFEVRQGQDGPALNPDTVVTEQ